MLKTINMSMTRRSFIKKVAAAIGGTAQPSVLTAAMKAANDTNIAALVTKGLPSYSAEMLYTFNTPAFASVHEVFFSDDIDHV